MARAVAAGEPHHVTQRGNRKQPVFFGDADYRLYRSLMRSACDAAGVAVWAYCLMPNHVHLIAVPSTQDALALALGDAHRRYSIAINQREGWTGFLWQGRFSSCAVDEPHLIAAARHIEINPVRVGFAKRPEEWPWSSARAHLRGRDDQLAKAAALLDLVSDWAGLLSSEAEEATIDRLRRNTRTGRPLGSDDFVDAVEASIGRTLRPGRPGRKPRDGTVRVAG